MAKRSSTEERQERRNLGDVLLDNHLRTMGDTQEWSVVLVLRGEKVSTHNTLRVARDADGDWWPVPPSTTWKILRGESLRAEAMLIYTPAGEFLSTSWFNGGTHEAYVSRFDLSREPAKFTAFWTTPILATSGKHDRRR